MMEKNNQGFTPLDHKESSFQMKSKRYIVPRFNRSSVFRGADRTGFTLIELLLYAAIFAGAAAAFTSVLLIVVQIQFRQGGAATVNQESNSVLQTLQRYIETSTAIDIEKDTPSNELRLIMKEDAKSPTRIFVQNEQLFIQEGVSEAKALTTGQVRVTDVSFVKRENVGGKDLTSFSFTLEFNTDNEKRFFSQVVRSGVARVNAATFESNLVPATQTLKVGVQDQKWQSINDVIHFSGSNIGIGGIGIVPTQKLEIQGGIRFDTTSIAQPTCNSGVAGTVWFTAGAAGVKDEFEVCAKAANDTYAWRLIY